MAFMQISAQKFAHAKEKSLLGRFTICSTLCFQFLVFFTQAASAQTFCSDSNRAIQQSIAQILNQSHLQRTRWGLDIRAVSATGLEPIYQQNAAQFFLPASTAKLFTAAALVETFEPDYRIETPLWVSGQPPVLEQLRVQGAGDPSLLDPQLQQIGQQLKARGVKAIKTLVADGRPFGPPKIIPSWEWEDLQTSDGVPISGLSFSQNSLPLELSPTLVGKPLQLKWLDGQPHPSLQVVNLSRTVRPEESEYISLDRSLSGQTLTIRGQLRAGASSDISYVAIAEPEAYFLHRLKGVLESEGIQVKHVQVEDSDSTAPLPPRTRKLGSLTSPPLIVLLKEINQSSNNFYTESLLQHFGWSKLKSSKSDTALQPEATTDKSLEVLRETLLPLGIPAESYHLQDASGLSRQNLVSPESLTSVLIAVLNWKADNVGQLEKFETFKNSLAIAGQMGTLKRRFQNSPIAGKLFAKTGTLRGTVTLSGFLFEPGQPTIVLSVMANHSDQSIATLRTAIDDIVLNLRPAQTCVQNSHDRPMDR